MKVLLPGIFSYLVYDFTLDACYLEKNYFGKASQTTGSHQCDRITWYNELLFILMQQLKARVVMLQCYQLKSSGIQV